MTLWAKPAKPVKPSMWPRSSSAALTSPSSRQPPSPQPSLRSSTCPDAHTPAQPTPPAPRPPGRTSHNATGSRRTPLRSSTNPPIVVARLTTRLTRQLVAPVVLGVAGVGAVLHRSQRTPKHRRTPTQLIPLGVRLLAPVARRLAPTEMPGIRSISAMITPTSDPAPLAQHLSITTSLSARLTRHRHPIPAPMSIPARLGAALEQTTRTTAVSATGTPGVDRPHMTTLRRSKPSNNVPGARIFDMRRQPRPALSHHRTACTDRLALPGLLRLLQLADRPIDLHLIDATPTRRLSPPVARCSPSDAAHLRASTNATPCQWQGDNDSQLTTGTYHYEAQPHRSDLPVPKEHSDYW